MTKIMQLPAHKLFIDLTYQRDPKDDHRLPKLTKRSKNLDEDLLDVLMVSARTTGKMAGHYAIMDGGGRYYMVAKILKRENYVFKCLVHEGLTVKQEAEMFEAHFARDKITPNDKFKVACTLGDKDALAIKAIMHKHGKGTDVNDMPTPKKFFAMYKAKVLDNVVKVMVRSAWSKGHVTGIAYETLGVFIRTLPDYDEHRLLETMRKNSFAMINAEIRRRVAGHDLHPNKKAVVGAKVLTDFYNKQLKKQPRLDVNRFRHLPGDGDFYAIMGTPEKASMSEDDAIPEWLKLTQEQRKAAWELNPPKPIVWRGTDEQQEQLRKSWQQAAADRKRLNRCVSKQKRIVREQKVEAMLQDTKSRAEGKRWDARTARWIDPIAAAIKPDEGKTKMVRKTSAKRIEKDIADTEQKEIGEAVKASGPTAVFGFKPDTNYDRMMAFLVDNMNAFVSVRDLAVNAYGTDRDIIKHCRRVVTMARKVQEKVITPKHLSFEIKKERTENAISIGLFTK